MLTETQFATLSTLAWLCDGEAVCIHGITADQKALVENGLATVGTVDEWTVLTLTPAGLRQLAS